MYEAKKRYFSPRKIRNAGVTLCMILVSLLILYPFFIMIMVSFKTTKEALVSPATLPAQWKWQNYVTAWESMNIGKVLMNTVFVVALSLAGIIILSGFAAYIIAWSKNTRFYNFIYLFFLSGIMIPFYTTLVPLVKQMNQMNLTNSLIGIVIYYCGRNMPMAVFLYTGFVRGISKEILEAGRIDGANMMQLYWRVLFPIMKPITTTILVLDALSLWNDFLMPRIMLTSSKLRTVTLAQFYFRAENNNKWELAFAAYIITIIPILIFYFVFQKDIVKGVASGAVKG